jgi:hypothetical protein
MSIFGLQPWPTDSVMIVCPAVRNARLSEMRAPRAGNCRHCGRAVLCDGRTYRQAERFAAGRRPVAYFCESCPREYDLSTIAITNDPAMIQAGVQAQISERN